MIDIYTQIKICTDLDYLKELSLLVDVDINNVGTDSDIIKKLKANMRNTTIEELEKISWMD